MKLLPTEDTETLRKRLISKDGSIEMGIYVVMFGFRVRAGYIDSHWGECVMYELDWCGGADYVDVMVLYNICKSIISNSKAGKAFNGVPRCSEVKPFYKDATFLNTVVDLAGEIKDPASVTAMELNGYRESLFNNLFKQIENE